MRSSESWHATWTTDDGENVVATEYNQVRMGHTSARTTLDMYAHAMPGKDRQVANMIDSVISTDEQNHPG